LVKRQHDVLPKFSSGCLSGYIRRALDLQQTTQVEYSLEINNTEVWLVFLPLMEDSVICYEDITERKRVEQQLSIALHDALTVTAKSGIVYRTSMAITRAKQRADDEYLLCCSGLTRFKVVNIPGHLVGDQLIAIARRPEMCVS